MQTLRKTRQLRGSAMPEENGWQVFEVRLKTLQESLDPSSEDFHIDEVLPNALKNKYKNREVSGTLLHYSIDVDAETLGGADKHGGAVATEDMCLALVLEAKGSVDSWMCFNAFGKEGRVQPIHLAAARGLLPAIRLLVEHAADLNTKSTIAGEPNFCAIHDASFAGQNEAVKCLLELRADPNVRNKDGKLPIHITAEVGADQVAELLVENKARLDGELPNQVGTTPINIAVRRRLFREDRIHILAPFCYEDYDVDFFSSMVEICRENVPAAKALVTSILGSSSQAKGVNDPAAKRRDRVVKAVSDGRAKGLSPIPSLTDIIKLAPDVAVAILDIFLVKPKECSFSHPLPKVANLRQEPMFTNYNADFEWRFDGTKSDPTKQKPPWHARLAPPPKGNELDIEVKVKYLSFPNLLDIRVLHALNHARDKKIFGSIAIQAVVRCSWKVTHKAVKLNILFECIVLLIFYWWATVTLEDLPIATRQDHKQCQWIPEWLGWHNVSYHRRNHAIINGGRLPYVTEQYTTTRPPMRAEVDEDPWGQLHHNAALTSMSVLWGFGYRELINLCYFIVMQRIWGFPCYLLVNSNTFTEVTATALLVGFLSGFTAYGQNGCVQFLFCANLLSRAVKILLQVCLLEEVGDQILPILSSFRPMSKFFFFAFCIILTFLGAFASMRNHEKVEHIVEILFFGLLAGDGDSYERLRALDHKGQLSLFLLVVSTVTFTVCTLNLMIAIFSKVYKDNASEATLLFLQHRASCIEQYLKFPVWNIDCRFVKNYLMSSPDAPTDVEPQQSEPQQDETDSTEHLTPSHDWVPHILSGIFFILWTFLGVLFKPDCISVGIPLLLTASLIFLQAGIMQNMWFNRDFYKRRLFLLHHRESMAEADGPSMTLLQSNSREVRPRTSQDYSVVLPMEVGPDLLEYEDDFFIWMCHRGDYHQGTKRDEIKSMLKELAEQVQTLSKSLVEVNSKVDKLQLRLEDTLPPRKRISVQGMLKEKQKSRKDLGGAKSRTPGEFRPPQRELSQVFEVEATDSANPVTARSQELSKSEDSKEPSSVQELSSPPSLPSPPQHKTAHLAVPAQTGFPLPVLNDLDPPPPRYFSPQKETNKQKRNR